MSLIFTSLLCHQNVPSSYKFFHQEPPMTPFLNKYSTFLEIYEKKSDI